MMRRRRWLLSSSAALAALASGGTTLPLRAQTGAHAGHAPLPVAPSSPDPYARLQGGVPHHLTPEQESQRKTASPAPPGPQGRWVARAALPLPRSEMAWATAAAGRMHIVGGYGEGAVQSAVHEAFSLG